MRRKILGAARGVILETGFKATTMEVIAARAGVAKGTLYGHFANKDGVFAALTDDLAAERAEAFAQAFAQEGALADRVGQGLAARFGLAAALLRGPAFGHELIGDHDRLDSADLAIGEEIIASMAAAGIAEAEKTVPVLMAACWGVLAKAASPEDVREDIMVLCEKMVGQDAPAPSAHRTIDPVRRAT